MTESNALLEAELNTALQSRQLFLLYQPIYDLGTGRMAGLSALVRWQHPKRGVLDAEDFVPLAEETGLIVPLGRWALEEACNRNGGMERCRSPDRRLGERVAEPAQPWTVSRRTFGERCSSRG